MKIIQNLIKELIQKPIRSESALSEFKRKVAKQYKIPLPSNQELLQAYHNLLKVKRVKPNKRLEELLRVKKIRSLSGIVNVSVLTKPYPCPGKCIYCPEQKGLPKSYLENEPAVMRALANKFDPYLQTKNRIRALKEEGHPTDKIELRIIGGTWSYYPKRYQTWFIKKCFDACNERKASTLKEAQKINEEASHRIVGITIETRPDFIDKEEIKRLRNLGVTRVELGVQSIYDDILELNRRGHKVEATIQATKLLKDAGFKVSYQIMPNLPGATPSRDKKMFKELFSNPNFRPDLLKIYPTALLKEAPLYKWWQEGKYKPYSKRVLIELLKEIKKEIPYYVRIQRITRDIPAQKIIAGPAKISNLRQIVNQILEKEGWKCHCIRCREVRNNYNPKTPLYLFREDYFASGGKEIFLTFEDRERRRLYSLLRLRIPSYYYEKHSSPIFSVLKEAAIIREIHTYGQLVPLSEKKNAPQHQGLGKKLIKIAEEITKNEFHLPKIAVIAGVGVRSYYRKLNYTLRETYMVKRL